MAIQTGLLNLQDFRPTPEAYGVNEVHIPFDNVNHHEVSECEMFIVFHIYMAQRKTNRDSPPYVSLLQDGEYRARLKG